MNEKEVRRIVREEIRAAFAALAGDTPSTDLYDALFGLSDRFGKCSGKINGGYDRCDNDDDGACPEHDPEHDPAAPGIKCTLCSHAPHGAGACIGNRNWCSCTGREAEDPDAPVPFTVTPLGARFQDVPPVVPRRRTGAHCTVCGHATHGADSCPRCTCTGLLSAWSTSPITGDDVCTACPHTRSAHASAGCMDCACTTTRRAQ